MFLKLCPMIRLHSSISEGSHEGRRTGIGRFLLGAMLFD